MTYTRFTVHEISTPAGPHFQVIDGDTGEPVGSPEMFRADAESTASRLNHEDAIAEPDWDGEPIIDGRSV